ncbi:urease subunit beta [cf. Phormidesmis sp. LEGE 11477]|uniref:urease subunit beta n=1 Tax=cf. Phormidesmis sp. LEGE 11477 TaxID=1828680 RepID=UPI001D13888C|nr:urease subunit beta [cf. Phormidesmis sp. LEGE 11477]
MATTNAGSDTDGFLVPGAIVCEPGALEINAGREFKTLEVANVGDRPIQVGSHYHFFEVNRMLRFDRAQSLGFRLDIPAGTAVRFEPGDTKTVTVVALAGDRIVRGLNDLVNGSLDDPQVREAAIARLEAQGFSST